RMPVLDWPYVEGLRMDEAMHPLTILAVGLYGEVIPNQDGAPIRLVVPWKYGFKSIKSIVKIRFVEKQPVNTWQRQARNEYGFYSNVNPTVDHPRWSQATERRLPGLFKNIISVAALGPAGWLVWAAYTGNFSADPLADITNDTGVWTLRFLCLTLAVTPLRRLTGWNSAIRFRRMLGLFAFFYGTLHL